MRIAVLIGLLAVSVTAQVDPPRSLAAPAGWRFPKEADLKQAWSEKHWVNECRKAQAAAKKGAKDAMEEIGNKPPPTNTRNETDVDSEECWKPDFPVHVAFGDYNGDGIQDEARILISTTKRGTVGFFVFLKTQTKKVDTVRIATIPKASPQNHFIGTQASGERIDTACGKGYWDCKSSEPKAITLRRDGVIFGMFEAWDSLAYWDSSQNRFKVVQLSD